MKKTTQQLTVLELTARADMSTSPTIITTELITDATSILYDLDYSPRSAKYVIATWNQFARFCREKGEEKYTQTLRDEFLQRISACGFKHGTVMRKTAAMTQLDSFSKTGSWKKGHAIQWEPLPRDFVIFLAAYDALLLKRAYSDCSRETVRKFCCGLMYFLCGKGICELSKLTRAHIASYLLTFNGHAKSTVRCELSRLRQALRAMYLLEYTKEDLSDRVPSYNLGQSDSISKIWDSREIAQVLDTVDKSSAKGKRDRAFIMIASELGVRSVDIRNLRLADINWEKCSISFVQSKTGKQNVLPLSETLGSAIIDYLRMRPETNSSYLFVKLTPPYEQMAKFNTSFHKYVQRSGVQVSPDAHHGLHSLRATVATKLLDADVSPDVIVPFLGHSDNHSLHSYIRLDIENLRECALSFEGGELI